MKLIFLKINDGNKPLNGGIKMIKAYTMNGCPMCEELKKIHERESHKL